VIALGRQGFLTPTEALSVLRTLSQAQAPVTLGGVTPGVLSLHEEADAVTVLVSGTPVLRLDRATFRGGWCNAPGANAPFWDVALDLHGDGCGPILDRLRGFKAMHLQHPRLQIVQPGGEGDRT